MSNIQIPNLPAAIALNGTEQLEGVQAGTSVKLTVAQLGAYITAQYPPPGVSSIATSAPLTGGTITTSGTIGLAGAGITNYYLATMNAGTIKANVTGGSAQPTDATPSAVLDIISSSTGRMLYRGAGGWTSLAIGASGYVLGSNGVTPGWVPTSSLLPDQTGQSGKYLTTDGSVVSWAFPTVAASSVAVGTTLVTGGVGGNILYNNAGTLGELATTGSGNVVRATSPAFTGTPTFAGATSGTIGLVATAVAGSNTLTLPAATDTLVGKATTDTLTNKTISGANNTLSNIGNSSLTNSSITINGSSVSLGSSVTVTAVASSVTVGTTAVTSGTSGRVLYDNAGVLGEYTVTGTAGSVVLSASPTLTGTLTAPNITAPAASDLILNAPTGQTINQTINGTSIVKLQSTALYPTTTATIDLGGSGNRWAGLYTGTANLSGALTYGGVTLANSVTGTGSMVLSASPSLTGTLTVASTTTLTSSTLTLGTNGLVQWDGSNMYVRPTTTGNLILGASNTNVATVNTSGITIATASQPVLAINSTAVGSWKSYINFLNSGSLKWQVGADINASGQQNFFFYDNVNTATRAYFDGSGMYLNGRMGIAAVPQASVNLYNAGNITGGTFAHNYSAVGVGQSDVTDTIAGYYSNIGTAAASFTAANVSHFWATQGTFGAGSSVTTQTGFRVGANLTGATNNYGFYGGLASAANTYNLYMGGTAANYLGGATTFNAAITYGGVTLANSVTGTGSMVLSASPTFSTSIGVNRAPATSTLIAAGGNVGTTTDSVGASMAPTVQSASSNSYIGYYSAGNTQATAFTLGSVRHFQTNGITPGAGSTLTNQYGFFVESTFTQGTYNYGFYSALAAGTNRWNLYMAGDAPNYLSGALGIGSTSLTAMSLRTQKNITGNTSGYNIVAQGAIQSDVTAAYYGFWSQPTTAAASFTLNSLIHYGAQFAAANRGAGSTVTNQYGFYVAAGTLDGASTNNFAFYHNLAAATGIYGFYGAGTAANYFGGATTFNAAITYGGVTLSNSVTGTGSMVLSTSPTFTTSLTINGVSNASSFNVYATGGVKYLTVKPETSADVTQMGYWNGAAWATLWLPGTIQIDTLKYGGVTLSNSVTGTGSMVLSASPTFTGTPLSTTAAQATNNTQIATTAYVDRVALQQEVATIVTAVATGTTTIPRDDTIPQNTEGDQYMTLAITPKSATSILEIDVVFNGTNSATGTFTVALFQDTTANALAAVGQYISSAGNLYNMKLNYKMTSGTTSATTFKIRAGSDQAGTTTFNGSAGGRLYGGVFASSIRIREIGI